MKSKSLLFLIIAGSFILVSCTKYPPSSDRLLEDLAVYTKYDTNIKFSQFKTFAISDSVGYVSEKDGKKDTGWLPPASAQPLVNQIKQNMTSRGYVLVTRKQNPDLGFNVVVIKNVNVQVYDPGWYWGYPGYYPPYYWGGGGYYYPYYPTYVTSYATGTLLIDMVDIKNITPDGKIYIRWNAYIRGLVTGYHTMTEIQASIDQAFRQTKAFSQ